MDFPQFYTVRVPPRSDTPGERFVQVGVVGGAHGRSGQLRITPTTDNPERFRPGGVIYIQERSYTIQAVVPGRERVLVKRAGVESPEDARALVNAPVEVPATEVPPVPDGTYYHFQVLDMDAYDAAGGYLGRLAEVLSTGANDVYVVRSQETELLVPAIADVVLSVDVEGRRMTVDLPEGLEPKPLPGPKLSPPRARRRKTRPAPS